MGPRLFRVGMYLGWVLLTMALFAAPAAAWGPGAHVETGMYILRHLSLIAPLAARLIRTNPFAFIYGSVCPDMVVGKRWMAPEHNNHRWETGFAIMKSATSPTQQSFAFGYLSHLAADTVAHNHYVPDRLLDEYSRRRRSHVMHELVFDATLEPEVWVLARQASAQPFPECDALLLQNMGPTPLPRSVNYRLFHSAVLLLRLGGWQRIIHALQNRWSDQVDETAMMEYRRRMHRAVLDFLIDPESAECLRHSPTGGAILPQAETIKVMLKRLAQDGLDPAAHQEIVTAFRRWREDAMKSSAR